MNIISPLTLLLIPLMGSLVLVLLKEKKIDVRNHALPSPLAHRPPHLKVVGLGARSEETRLNKEIKYNLINFQSSKYRKNLFKQIALITSLINLFIQ